MRKEISIALAGTLLVCVPPSALAQPGAVRPDLQAGHIAANVPPAPEFDAILRRDLEAFFVDQGIAASRVEFELLRKGPTQSGVSYPKFYAWVRVISMTGESQSGAVRLSAQDRVRFEVTHYVPRASIQLRPDVLDGLFPAALVPIIVERAKRP